MAFEQWLFNEHFPLLERENYKPEVATYRVQLEEWFNKGYKSAVAHAHKNVAHYERKKLSAAAPEDRLRCDLKIAEQWKLIEELENDMKAKFLQDLSEMQAEKAQLAQQAQQRIPGNVAEMLEEMGMDEAITSAFSSLRFGG